MDIIRGQETPQSELPIETTISQADIELLVKLATDFETTVIRLPGGKGEQYIEDHRRSTECRKRADLGRMTLL